MHTVYPTAKQGITDRYPAEGFVFQEGEVFCQFERLQMVEQQRSFALLLGHLLTLSYTSHPVVRRADPKDNGRVND